jgi:hypothetical protein
MRIGIATLLLLTLAGAVPAPANDSTGYLAVGGLVLTQTPDIEIRSEVLYVSEKEIRVRYRFFNTSRADIKTLVAFPIPDLAPLEDNEYAMPAEDTVNFLGFETKAGGQLVTNGIEQRAVVNGIDYTDLLKSLDIPLSPAHDSAQKGLNTLSQEQQAMVKAGIVREEETDFGKGMVKSMVPNCISLRAMASSASRPLRTTKHAIARTAIS